MCACACVCAGPLGVLSLTSFPLESIKAPFDAQSCKQRLNCSVRSSYTVNVAQINLPLLCHSPSEVVLCYLAQAVRASRTQRILCVLILGLHWGNLGFVSAVVHCLHPQSNTQITQERLLFWKSHTGITLLPAAENEGGKVDAWSPRSSLGWELTAAAAEVSRVDFVLQQLIGILITAHHAVFRGKWVRWGCSKSDTLQSGCTPGSWPALIGRHTRSGSFEFVQLHYCQNSTQDDSQHLLRIRHVRYF